MNNNETAKNNKKDKEKKYKKNLMLARNKLNNINTLISQALRD